MAGEERAVRIVMAEAWRRAATAIRQTADSIPANNLLREAWLDGHRAAADTLDRMAEKFEEDR